MDQTLRHQIGDCSFAQRVAWLSHIQRLCPHCSSPRFESQPGYLYCMSPPSLSPCFMSSWAVLWIKPYKGQKLLKYFSLHRRSHWQCHQRKAFQLVSLECQSFYLSSKINWHNFLYTDNESLWFWQSSFFSCGASIRFTIVAQKCLDGFLWNLVWTFMPNEFK